MIGRVRVVCGRVAVGKKSYTAVDRAWSGNLGDRDDRVDFIGSGNIPLTKRSIGGFVVSFHHYV